MTRRMLILKSQKDEIFCEITGCGLEPSAFEWTEVPSTIREETVVSKLIHKEAGFYFLFDHGRDSAYGSHFYERSPAPNLPFDRQYPGGWELLKTGFLEWLTALKLEMETPDHWTQVGSESALVELARALIPNNEPLTSEERKQIRDAISEIRDYLAKRETLDHERWHAVNQRLDQIIDASGRLGRKDWILLTLGALVSIFASGVFAPEQATLYAHYALGALRSVMMRIGLLPPSAS